MEATHQSPLWPLEEASSRYLKKAGRFSCPGNCLQVFVKTPLHFPIIWQWSITFAFSEFIFTDVTVHSLLLCFLTLWSCSHLLWEFNFIVNFFFLNERCHEWLLYKLALNFRFLRPCKALISTNNSPNKWIYYSTADISTLKLFLTLFKGKMITYSRTFLLSLKHWWKYQHQNKLISAASLPLSTSSWAAIKNLNLLRPRRGKRSGIRRHPAVSFSTFSNSNLQNQSAINNSLQIQNPQQWIY